MLKLRKLKPAALDEIIDDIANGEIYKPPVIKANDKNSTLYRLSAPTTDEPEAFVLKSRFYGVVLNAREHWQAPQDDPDGEKVEKRVLTILRSSNGLAKDDAKFLNGRTFPEVMWVSGISKIKQWKLYLKDVVLAARVAATLAAEGKLSKIAEPARDIVTNLVKNLESKDPADIYDAVIKRLGYSNVIFMASLEMAESKKTGYKWSKPIFKMVRYLTDEEAAYNQHYVDAVRERDAKYVADADLDDYEDEALGRPASRRADVDEDKVHQQAIAKRDIDDDDPDEPATTTKQSRGEKKQKAEKPSVAEKPAEAPKSAPATAPAASDDDEDDEPDPTPATAATGTRSTVVDDVDDDDED